MIFKVIMWSLQSWKMLKVFKDSCLWSSKQGPLTKQSDPWLCLRAEDLERWHPQRGRNFCDSLRSFLVRNMNAGCCKSEVWTPLWEEPQEYAKINDHALKNEGLTFKRRPTNS